MSPRKSIVEKYIEGFNRSDHAQILSCLADDVVAPRASSRPRASTAG